jgi:hypothetical protein
MPDKVEPKDLEKVLVRLTTEWQELADLLISLGKSQDRVIEVEKILLRDASGQYRGKISADPDGSVDLFLSDRAGNAWARLGVNQAGEAFLELKDKNGESSFKVAVGVPSPGTGAGPTAVTAPQPLDSPGAAPSPDHEAPPGWDANSGVIDRQKQIEFPRLAEDFDFERQNRRQKFYWALILVVLGVVLATQAYVLFRPYPPGLAVEALVVRDANGRIRASLSATGDQVRLDLLDPQGHRRATLGLGSDGAPGLEFYDRYHRLRAELNLGPDGEPQFALRDKHSLQGKTEPKPLGDSSPPAGPAKAVSPARDAEPETGFVGFKNSNKYHYPTCKWVKGAKPEWLIKFKSAADAQDHHYVPCQVCKPPPLSR